MSYDEAYAAGFEDMHRRIPDTSKVRDLIGWVPQRSLDDIIGDVVATMLAKRLAGNTPAPTEHRARTYLNRLVLDRDSAEKEEG